MLVDPWGHEIRRSTQKTSADNTGAAGGELEDNLASRFEPDNYKSVHNELIYIQKLEFDPQKKVFRQKKPEQLPIKTQYVDSVDEKYDVNYKESEILGNGAFGTVRTATQKGKNSRTKYAIKMIHKSEMQKSKTYMKLLNDELKILSEVNNTRIVKVFDIIEDNMFYCIVTELIQGGSLVDRVLEHGPFGEADARIIIR